MASAASVSGLRGEVFPEKILDTGIIGIGLFHPRLCRSELRLDLLDIGRKAFTVQFDQKLNCFTASPSLTWIFLISAEMRAAILMSVTGWILPDLKTVRLISPRLTSAEVISMTSPRLLRRLTDHRRG